MAEGSTSNWDGMLRWWSVVDHSDVNYREWRRRSQEEDDDDVIGPDERVYEIAAFFYETVDDQGDVTTEATFGSLLNELQGYVKSTDIDVASVLHSVHALAPLLHNVLRKNEQAGVRAKAAEAVTTMVQNNPRNQQLVMEVNGLQPLFYNSFKDPDATSRTKALGAISALIRNNKPGITAFRLDDGYPKLRDALSTKTQSVAFQREALNLIQYLLNENSADCNIVTVVELPRIMVQLASSDDAEVRKASLGGLLVLARYGGNSVLSVYYDELKQVLEGLIQGIRSMATEDLCAAMEERQLVDSLWSACYNGKGPPLLTGEDATAP